uniref:KH domain-containing protein n=1 Tax=Mesocestoides corti TaxID=53468 RepID=A0A5K3EFY6_MESCO
MERIYEKPDTTQQSPDGRVILERHKQIALLLSKGSIRNGILRTLSLDQKKEWLVSCLPLFISLACPLWSASLRLTLLYLADHNK